MTTTLFVWFFVILVGLFLTAVLVVVLAIFAAVVVGIAKGVKQVRDRNL